MKKITLLAALGLSLSIWSESSLLLDENVRKVILAKISNDLRRIAISKEKLDILASKLRKARAALLKETFDDEEEDITAQSAEDFTQNLKDFKIPKKAKRNNAIDIADVIDN